MTTEIFNDLLMVADIIGCVANAVVMACFYLSLERDSSLLRMPKWFHAVAVAVCVAFSFVAWILVIVARLADKLVKKYEKKKEGKRRIPKRQRLSRVASCSNWGLTQRVRILHG